MKAYIITTKDNHGRFTGIENYPDVMPEPIVWYGVTPDDVKVPQWFVNYNYGRFRDANVRRIYCCNLSKLYVAEYHLKNYPNEDLLMLEDDVFFTKDAEKKYLDLCCDVPNDWKFVFLGGEHFRNKKRPPELIAPGILKCKAVIGNEAFIIKSDAVPKYIEHLALKEEDPYSYCDIRLCELMDTMPTYAPLGFIAGQKDGWSNIWQKDRVMGIKNNFNYVDLDGKICEYNEPAY